MTTPKLHEMAQKWRELRAKWLREDMGLVSEVAAAEAVQPVRNQTKRMPRRVGKTARDRERKELRATLAEITGTSYAAAAPPSSVTHFEVKRKVSDL